jgi:hypothetical protein
MEVCPKALPYYARVMKIFKLDLGDGHPDTKSLVKNIELIKKQLQFFDQRVRYFQNRICMCFYHAILERTLSVIIVMHFATGMDIDDSNFDVLIAVARDVLHDW